MMRVRGKYCRDLKGCLHVMFVADEGVRSIEVWFGYRWWVMVRVKGQMLSAYGSLSIFEL